MLRRLIIWWIRRQCVREGYPCQYCITGLPLEGASGGGWGTPLMLITEGDCFHPTDTHVEAFKQMHQEEMTGG